MRIPNDMSSNQLVIFIAVLFGPFFAVGLMIIAIGIHKEINPNLNTMKLLSIVLAVFLILVIVTMALNHAFTTVQP